MRAVVVGGAGSMGRWAVRGIARLGGVDELLVADIDVARAQTLVDEVGGPCVAVRLDATDPATMAELFAGCDVVLNTMGPFSIFARRILEAALDHGCDYLDIDDDWESTVEAFELDERAREQGCRVVKGIGGSPGISNLCAVVAADRLDDVEEILTGWSMRGAVIEEEAAYPATSPAGAAVEHWLLQISGTIRAWTDGAPADIRPLQRVLLDYPGLGRVAGRTVGHPEAVTLPRRFPGLRRSLNVTSGPDWLFDHARSVAAAYDAGRVSLQEGAALLGEATPPAERGVRDRLGTVWCHAVGTRGGERVAVSVEPAALPPGGMGGGTGTALAVGFDMLRRGVVGEPGVHTPEEVLDPAEFFACLASFTSLERGQEPLVVRELVAPAPTTVSEGIAV